MLTVLEEELGAIVDAGHTPMLDTVSKGPYYGGTGETFDWGLATELAKKFDFVLSGGLNPENVSQAIEQVGPWVVDVSSGVETGGRSRTQRRSGRSPGRWSRRTRQSGSQHDQFGYGFDIRVP